MSEQKKKWIPLPQPQHPIANDHVLEETSLELAVPIDLVKEVVLAQSEFTATKIREGGFEGVMWPFFGKIRVKVSKVHMYHKVLGDSNINKNTQTNK